MISPEWVLEKRYARRDTSRRAAPGDCDGWRFAPGRRALRVPPRRLASPKTLVVVHPGFPQRVLQAVHGRIARAERLQVEALLDQFEDRGRVVVAMIDARLVE